MSQQYSFPMLKRVELREVLAELGMEVTDDDLTNPAETRVKQLYEHLIELLLHQRREDMLAPSLVSIDLLEHPEMHEESLEKMAFVKAWCTPRARSVPPMPSTSFWQIASPSPVPRVLVVTNGSNRRSRTSPEIPGPSSTTTIEASGPTCSHTRSPPSVAASRAFWRRFTRIWRTWRRPVRVK